MWLGRIVATDPDNDLAAHSGLRAGSGRRSGSGRTFVPPLVGDAAPARRQPARIRGLGHVRRRGPGRRGRDSDGRGCVSGNLRRSGGRTRAAGSSACSSPARARTSTSPVPINRACVRFAAVCKGVAARARCRIFGTDSRERTSGGEARPSLASVHVVERAPAARSRRKRRGASSSDTCARTGSTSSRRRTVRRSTSWSRRVPTSC